jgi:hypothetical protein
MPLNIACFIAVCQPSERHLATYTAEWLLMSKSHCFSSSIHIHTQSKFQYIWSNSGTDFGRTEFGRIPF